MKNRRENQAIPRKKSLFRRICSRGMLLVGMLMCVNFWSYASGQVKTVSLNVKDKALKEVLGMVREQAGVRFIYSEVELRKAKPVSVEFENQPLQEAMEKLLQVSLLHLRLKEILWLSALSLPLRRSRR